MNQYVSHFAKIHAERFLYELMQEEGRDAAWLADQTK